MRFLFSAMMASADLGGEPGVARLISAVEVERRDGGWTCCDARRDGGSRKGFGVAVRFWGSALGTEPGPRAPSLLAGLCRPAPIDTDRDLRAASRSSVGKLGWSSSGSRFTRSVWRFCDEDDGRDEAINWETASPPRCRTRRWCCAATSKRVATRLRFGLGEFISGRNSAWVEARSSSELGGGDGKACT
jgi:hypothetical protein